MLGGFGITEIFLLVVFVIIPALILRWAYVKIRHYGEPPKEVDTNKEVN